MSHIIKITNFEDPELDVFARLTETQLRNKKEPEKGIFIAESPKVIERALDAGYEPISLLMECKHINGQAKNVIARCGNVPVYTAEFDILTRLTGFALTRGVLCAMHRKPEKGVEEILQNATRVAVLENVQNPTNVGAIFRSAAALNMDAVLLTPNCSDPLYRRACRVSMGTVFQIPWTHIGKELNDWPEAGIGQLHSLGFQTVAMALQEDTLSIDDMRLQQAEKLAIILGTEGEGLATSTIAKCDYTVKIPMSNDVDSLNVAAASAVAFWELSRKKNL